MKKTALVLIMVMLVNMALWADDSTTDDGAAGIVILVIAITSVVLLGMSLVLEAEADAPDDGIRMVSLQTENSVPENGFGSLINFLNHVEVSFSQNDRIYAGLRFRF